jgi:hypothetical protein
MSAVGLLMTGFVVLISGHVHAHFDVAGWALERIAEDVRPTVIADSNVQPPNVWPPSVYFSKGIPR